MEAQDYRKPFVKFEVRAEEDRAQSLLAGQYMHKDVDYIIIVPHGSEGKLSIERAYSDWLAEVKPQTGAFHHPGGGSDTPLMGASRFPADWLRQIEEGYKAWKEGREIPVEGTALRDWPAVSPAQIKNCEGLHLLSVEQLAHCDDETLGRLGMGARALQQRAKAWLEANAGNAGKVAAESERLHQENEALNKRVAALEELLAKGGVKQTVEHVKAE